MGVAAERLSREELLECCASSRWAEAMAAAGPFASLADAEAASDAAFDTLGQADWMEAFAGHARIGDREGADAQGRREQAGADNATDAEQQALIDGNRSYEERFGHVFLICATGLDAATMLAALDARIGNDAATELANGAAEQRKITRLRLEQRLGA